MSKRRGEEDTVDMPAASLGAQQFFVRPSEKVDWEFGSVTHRGLVRETNEDHYAIIRRTRAREVLKSNVPLPEGKQLDAEAYFLVVADGMGGAPFGEFASRLAIQAAWEWSGRAASWVMKLRGLEAQQVQERANAFADVIRSEMQSHEEADPRLLGMGTTWTSAYLMNGDVVVAHLGDSRAYLSRPAGIFKITQDHTLAQEFIAEGARPEDVTRFRMVLTRALGGEEGDVRPDVSQVRAAAGNTLLLCSDGLTDVVSGAVIQEVVTRLAEPQAICEALLQLALDGGGPDNITILAARATGGS